MGHYFSVETKSGEHLGWLESNISFNYLEFMEERGLYLKKLDKLTVREIREIFREFINKISIIEKETKIRSPFNRSFETPVSWLFESLEKNIKSLEQYPDNGIVKIH